MSVLGTSASSGRNSGWFVSKVRASTRRRGPVCGDRPLCSASIWYIGLPATAPATGDGEALAATTAGDGDGPPAATADGAADAAGLGATGEAAGWITGLAGAVVLVPAAAGTLVTVIGGVWLWQATNRPVPPTAIQGPKLARKRRRLSLMTLLRPLPAART